MSNGSPGDAASSREHTGELLTQGHLLPFSHIVPDNVVPGAVICVSWSKAHQRKNPN